MERTDVLCEKTRTDRPADAVKLACKEPKCVPNRTVNQVENIHREAPVLLGIIRLFVFLQVLYLCKKIPLSRSSRLIWIEDKVRLFIPVNNQQVGPAKVIL